MLVLRKRKVERRSQIQESLSAVALKVITAEDVFCSEDYMCETGFLT